MVKKTAKQDGDQPNTGRDNDLIRSTYANKTEVTVNQDAVNILFGIEQARQEGKKEAPVQLLKNIELPPPVAKRLAGALKEALSNQEAECSNQESSTIAPVAAEDQKATAYENQAPPGPDESLEKIMTLFRHLGSLETTIDFEHSFKTVYGHLLNNRFLLGVNRLKMRGKQDERILQVCERIGMPKNLQDTFMHMLVEANHVYFGVEKDADTLIIKTYLEYRDKIEKEINSNNVSGHSFPLFTGFKWDALFPQKKSITNYAWYPSLPIPGILERMQRIFDSSDHHVPLEAASNIIKRASKKISHDEIQYLEVTEEGNPRRSFDVKIYNSGYRLSDIYPLLKRVMQHYNISNETFQFLYERVKQERLGHLAGGVDRHNRDFMTVYYGAKQIDSNQLRFARIAPAEHQRNRG